MWVGKDAPHDPLNIYAQNVGGATEPHISIKTHINIGDCKESEVTDIFIRNGYAYVLFKTVNETITGNNKALYSLGGVVRYKINNLAEDPVKIGFADDPDFENGVLEDYDYSENFYGAVKVIGFDEDNIYIADDGFDAADTPAGVRIVKNRNRIGVLNMNTNALTFTDAGPAKWYNEWKEWKAPNTKTIVWKRNASGFEYYQIDRGNEALNQPQLLTNNCKDVFCYDLDGNLYILKNDNKISMYPQVEGVYSGNLQYTTNNPVSNLNSKSGMAVDSSASDGYKYLYYVDNSNKIKRLKWQGNGFQTAAPDTSFASGNGIVLPSGNEPSAMAANKDGLFVASKNRTGDKYKITVQKYDKNGSPVGDSMEISSGSGGVHKNPIVEFIHSMQILNGRLYAVSYKTVGAGDEDNHIAGNDSQAVVSGRLLDLGPASDELPNEPHELWSGAEEDKGYAPYRFIAVKPKELVIANDGFYGENTNQGIQLGNQRNKVLTFSLSGTLLSEISTEAAFSRELEYRNLCGFIWY
ncbi:hypothetical protein H0R92_02975 [Treponema sp. OMZ 840]|uniref:hypothetical protein n=1 Tax=Treponema sp. OMZ 840 TaxID=244313 RepID=UPI003D8CFB23